MFVSFISEYVFPQFPVVFLGFLIVLVTNCLQDYLIFIYRLDVLC